MFTVDVSIGPLKASGFASRRANFSFKKGKTRLFSPTNCASGLPSASKPTIVRGTSYTPRLLGSAVVIATPIIALMGSPLM